MHKKELKTYISPQRNLYFDYFSLNLQGIFPVDNLVNSVRVKCSHIFMAYTNSGEQQLTPSAPPTAARMAVRSFQRNEMVSFFMMFVLF